MIAEIIINNNSRALNKTFDYNIPFEMQNDVKIGSRVYVSFANYKKLEEGFVIDIKEKSEYKVKDIQEVQNDELLEEKIELAKWMSKRYFCNISECIKLMLQPGTTTKEFSKRVKEKCVSIVELSKTKEEIEEALENKQIKSEKQVKLLNYLIKNPSVTISQIEEDIQISRDIVKRMYQKGYLEIKEEQVYRNPFINKKVAKSEKLNLNDEQEKAFQEIENAIDDMMYAEFLLFGVTGSGKTEVYLQVIEKVLSLGKTSIMLVPEISLTPQTVNRFIARFGEEKIAVLHSKLSVGERFDEWTRIKNGQAKIIIGARSAIFAPVKDLGIIIIDEEHDNSYKSDKVPRYNAKEIATQIAKNKNIPVVLGSATPDISSYHKAINEESVFLELTERANNSKLPEVEIVDLKQELMQHGNKSIISTRLHDEIQKNIQNKKQTILFLNRRGYSTFVICKDCGHTVKCKNCNITLTYHLKQNKLKCHYCGYEARSLTECPECKSKNIKYFGTGTQKVEEEVKKLFPTATTLRMDVDTVSKKNSHEEILDKFKNENIDILIGTQMVVKGHHFPNVTLVGVISADGSLNMDDFRATEKTFQILTQVAGRAGRGENPGRVIIQTYNPDNYSIEFSKEQDYKLFYETEILLRKQLKYPPFCDIIVIGVTSEKENKVKEVIKNLHQFLKQKIKTDNIPIILYPPLPAPIDRIKNKIRWRIIVKCKLDENLIDVMNEMLEKSDSEKNTDTRISIDVNPTNMN